MRLLSIALLLTILAAGCTMGREATFSVDNRSGQALAATFLATVDGKARDAETFQVADDAFEARSYKGKVVTVELSLVPSATPGAAARTSEATVETKTCPVGGLAFIVSSDLSVEPAHRC